MVYNHTQQSFQSASLEMSSNTESTSTSMASASGSWPHLGACSWTTSPVMSWSSGTTTMASKSPYAVDWNDGLESYQMMPNTATSTIPFGYRVPSTTSIDHVGQHLFGYDVLNHNVGNERIANDWLLCQPTNMDMAATEGGTVFPNSGWFDAGSAHGYADEQKQHQTHLDHQFYYKAVKSVEPYGLPPKSEFKTSMQSIYGIPAHDPKCATSTAFDTESDSLFWSGHTGDLSTTILPKVAQMNAGCLQPRLHTDNTQPLSNLVPDSNRDHRIRHEMNNAFVAGDQLWKDPLSCIGQYTVPNGEYQHAGASARSIHQDRKLRIVEHDGTIVVPSFPKVVDDDLQGSMLRNRAKDDYLLRCKAAGMSYKDIKTRGGFDEAESTLRGRYRTLIKPKEARVRKPEWSEADVAILKQTVAQFVTTTTRRHLTYPNSLQSRASKAQLHALNKVPWKKVAECMANRGCYRYGNATVKKKYWEVMELGRL